MSIHEIYGYKAKQQYVYEEIESNEKIIFDHYIDTLRKYETALNDLKMFETVKDYILENKLRAGGKVAIVNNEILIVNNRFGYATLKLEVENA